MQRLIFSLILHHVDQFYNKKQLVKLLVPRPGGTFLNQVGTSLGSKCTLPSSDSHGTAVIKQLRPKFKFPAKTEMASAPILAIRSN